MEASSCAALDEPVVVRVQVDAVLRAFAGPDPRALLLRVVGEGEEGQLGRAADGDVEAVRAPLLAEALLQALAGAAHDLDPVRLA